MIIGISACLLGQKVRYDGDHQAHDAVLAIAKQLNTRPICPEAHIGLGVPRPPIQLVNDLHNPIAVGKEDPALNPSEPLRALGKEVTSTWLGLSGFIVKSRSPSCGYGSTKVIIHDQAIRQGTGLFTEQLLANSDIPVIEETALEQQASYTQFIEHITAYYHSHWLQKGKQDDE